MLSTILSAEVEVAIYLVGTALLLAYALWAGNGTRRRGWMFPRVRPIDQPMVGAFAGGLIVALQQERLRRRATPNRKQASVAEYRTEGEQAIQSASRTIRSTGRSRQIAAAV
jgi:hypothetical protein